MHELWPDNYVIGVELPPAPDPGWYNAWVEADYIQWAKRRRPESIDVVIGNPPYGELAEPFVWSSLHLLRRGGSLLFLLPLEFLGGIGRLNSLYYNAPPRHVFISSRRLDFTGGSGDMRNHALYWWQSGWKGVPTLSWFDYRSTGVQLGLDVKCR